MGQYYKLVNEDSEEYLTPSLKKMWEIMNNPIAGSLAYLTADAPYDGGGTPTANYRRFKNENGDVDWDTYSQMNEIVWPNFGRWSGDRIRTVGDYAESGLYDSVVENGWDDITEDVMPEIRAFQDDTTGRSGIRSGRFGSYRNRVMYKVYVDEDDPTKFYGRIAPDAENPPVTPSKDSPEEAKRAAREMAEKQYALSAS